MNSQMVSFVLNLGNEKNKKKKQLIIDEIYDFMSENQKFDANDLLRHLKEKGIFQKNEILRRFLDWQVADGLLVKSGDDFYRVRE